MKFFGKKETLVFKTEQQKDNFIERLNEANVNYDIKEVREFILKPNMFYTVSLFADDLKKVG